MRSIGIFLGLALACVACRDQQPKPSPVPASSVANPPQTPTDGGQQAAARGPKHPPLSHECSEIPVGEFEAGSRPGSPGRNPEIEQEQQRVKLGGFEIDRLAYPNDPKLPPLTNVTRNEAVALCAERGARLCTELEWERACRGPASDEYSTGPTLLPLCLEQPLSCASGFDVLGLGLGLREWTQSNVLSASQSPLGAAVRGSRSGPAESHRCAARARVNPETKAEDLGFRCCRGAPNAARVVEPRQYPVFEQLKLDETTVKSLLTSDPRLGALAENWVFFREPDASDFVLGRVPGADRQGLRFSSAPLLYSPVPGSRFLLLTGRSGKDTTLVAAFVVVGDNRYQLTSSLIMNNETGPVVFGYHESIRPRLFFSTCWKCPGETGRILFRGPERIVIVQP